MQNQVILIKVWSCPLLSHHSLWPSVSCRVIWYVTRTPWIFREPSFSSVQRLTSVFSLCLCELPAVVPLFLGCIESISLYPVREAQCLFGVPSLFPGYLHCPSLPLQHWILSQKDIYPKHYIKNPSRNIQGHVRQPCSRIIVLYPLGLVVHERTGTREFQFCCWLGD